MRMDNPLPSTQLAKALIIGDGKCGKTDLAGMAGAENFNVVYLDGDVASQTIAALPIEARRNIQLLKCGDSFDENGQLECTYSKFFDQWISSRRIIWNDSKQRLHSVLLDGQINTTDEFLILKPARMDESCVLVIEWTTLAQSVMFRAIKDAGLSPGNIAQDERGEMRSIYLAAGERLTAYALAIQRAPCHVICLGHPSEFVKTQKPDGKTQRQINEKDLKVLWTKMVPKSSSNNHALSLPKYFTDVAWMEAKMLGRRVIDFSINPDRIGGGHFNESFDVQNRDKGDTSGFTFGTLVRKIGGKVFDSPQPIDAWCEVQVGFDATPSAKQGLVLKSPTTTTTVATQQISTPAPLQPAAKGLLNLSGGASRVAG
jgi:hypothetical protein